MNKANVQKALLAGALLAGTVTSEADSLEPSDNVLIPPKITSFEMWRGGTVGGDWFRPPSDVDVTLATSGVDQTTVQIPELSVPQGVTLRLSSVADTIRLEVAGNTVIRGVVDVRGHDLVIVTQEFRLESGGAFFADNYEFVATDVVIEGEFEPVAGGDYSVDLTAGGKVFAGSGVSSVNINVPSSIFRAPSPSTTPEAQLVPVPTSLALLAPALVALAPRRRAKTRLSGCIPCV